MQNRTWKQWLVLAALASAPGLVACDSEDPDTTPDASGDVIEDGGGDTTPDADPDATPDADPDTTPDATPDAEPDTTPDAETDTVEPPEGVCQNEADQAVLESVDVTGEAQTCGLGCLGDADPGACAGACVATETGLSEPCAGCYAGVVVCSIENCLAPCASDPSSEACSVCQAANCLDAYYTCTGEEPPPVEDACLNEADVAILETVDVTGEAQTCGLGCLGDADPGACAGACVATETGLSGDCAGCYAGVVVCSIENCLAPCASDPASEACTSCQETNCLETFYACTGTEPSKDNLLDSLKADTRFAGFVTALEAAELDETLANEDAEFTVFVTVLPEGTETKELTADNLDYYIIEGSWDAASLYSHFATTLSGYSLWIDTADGVVLNDVATVTEADIEASNGYIHVIDAELAPLSIVELVFVSGLFNDLVAFAFASGIAEDLGGEGPFTIFAPTDDALEGVTLPTGPEGDALLSYHASLTSKILAADFTDGFHTSGFDHVNWVSHPGGAEGSRMINQANITIADIVGTNGVVHAIDDVLFLPATSDLLGWHPGFTTMAAALDETSLADEADGNPSTVFAPNNDAFAALGALPTGADLIAAISRHIAAAFPSGAFDGTSYDFTTLGGQVVSLVGADGAYVTADGAAVIELVWSRNGAIITLSDVIASDAM